MAQARFFPEDLTPRALLGGIIVGSLLCCTNLYLGLQSAFITMASMQAALVGYGLLSCISRGRTARRRGRRHTSDELDIDGESDDDGVDGTEESRNNRSRTGILSPFTAQENAVLQATAVSLGSMPLSAGLIGIVPAFTLLNPRKDGEDAQPFTFGWGPLTVWCASMAYFGIFFASPMRPAMILREKLKFPSGSATAQLIALLHGEKLRDDSVRRKPAPDNDERVVRANVDEPHQSETDDEGDAADLRAAHSRQERRPLLRRSETEREVEKEVKSGWSALLATFAASMALALASFAFPVIYAMPAFDFLLPCHDAASMWGWYVTPSLSYVGQGIIMGPQTTISMFAGAIFGWAILSPIVHYRGWTNGVPTDAEAGSQAWILWVALAIMTSESIVGLVLLSLVQRKEKISAASTNAETTPSSDDFEPPSRLTPASWIIGGILVSSAVASLLVFILFSGWNVQLWIPPVGIVLAGLLSILAVRALGATDLNPVNALGKLSQLALAVLQPGNIVANMVGGALAEAGAMQAGELMQDYKTGHLLQASPRGQFFGQLIGSTVGIFVASTAYKLYERAYKLSGPDMPAPAARLWLNFARLINNGSLPPHSGAAMLIAGVVFALTTLLKGLVEASTSRAESHSRSPSARLARLRTLVACLPNGVAFAVGLGLNTPNYSLARVIGGLVVFFVQRRQTRRINDRRQRRREQLEQQQRDSPRTALQRAEQRPSRPQSSSSLPPVTLLIWSAGFVLGEGFASILLLFLKQAGLGPISCWGCRGGCSGGC